MRVLSVLLTFALFAVASTATELKPKAEAAFDRYIHAIETQRENELSQGRFLVIDGFPDSSRQEAYEQLQGGQLYIGQLHAPVSPAGQNQAYLWRLVLEPISRDIHATREPNARAAPCIFQKID